jgi:hypothetical protein
MTAVASVGQNRNDTSSSIIVVIFTTGEWLWSVSRFPDVSCWNSDGAIKLHSNHRTIVLINLFYMSPYPVRDPILFLVSTTWTNNALPFFDRP